MLRNFKLKLLLVIILVTAVGLVMQSGTSSKQMLEPVLKYVMENQYDVGKLISRYINIPGPANMYDALPVSGGTVLRQPCEFISIERNFGWHWNQEERKQKFCPGIYLKVKDKTPVKPILSGQVVEISRADGLGEVLISHDNSLFSLYGGLKEVLVDKGSKVGEDKLIGHTGESFYFEARGKDGPVNPQSIFQ